MEEEKKKEEMEVNENPEEPQEMKKPEETEEIKPEKGETEPMKKEQTETEKKETEMPEKQEKKEEKKAMQKTEKKGMKIPMYLIALVIILVIVAAATALPFLGVNLFNMNQGNNAGNDQNTGDDLNQVQDTGNDINAGNDFEKTTIKVKSFVTENWSNMKDENNTMFLLFEQREMPFEITEEIDAYSENGQALVEQFGVEVIPTILVNAGDLNSYSEINTLYSEIVTAIDERYELVDGYYVVPESHLDQLSHIKEFLDASENCVPGDENKSKVLYFEDPYCPASIGLSSNVQKIKEKFPEQAEFEYAYIPTHSADLFEEYGQENVELAAKYILAAQDQGMYMEFITCAMDIYCDSDGDGNADTMETRHCYEDSNHFGTPLSMEELDSCVTETGLDANALHSYIENDANAALQHYTELADHYLIMGTPQTVVDCKYTGYLTQADPILCVLHPETELCN